MGKIDKYLINEFKQPYIIWGIDGDWMVNILPKGYEFYPTDHCGIMTVDESLINPRFMAYLLEKAGIAIGFSRSNRASIDRIKSIQISVPNVEIQNTQMKKVYDLEVKIKDLNANQINLNKEINSIIDKYLI